MVLMLVRLGLESLGNDEERAAWGLGPSLLEGPPAHSGPVLGMLVLLSARRGGRHREQRGKVAGLVSYIQWASGRAAI